MSHVDAYRCDRCQEIKHESETIGISLQPDIFDTLESYPLVKKQEHAQAHICVKCARTYAINVAERDVDRRKDEKKYAARLKELMYALKHYVVTNLKK